MNYLNIDFQLNSACQMFAFRYFACRCCVSRNSVFSIDAFRYFVRSISCFRYLPAARYCVHRYFATSLNSVRYISTFHIVSVDNFHIMSSVCMRYHVVHCDAHHHTCIWWTTEHLSKKSPRIPGPNMVHAVRKKRCRGFISVKGQR